MIPIFKRWSVFFLVAAVVGVPLYLPAITWAQQAFPGDGAVTPPRVEVEVRGTKDPDWKPFRTMFKGVAAFGANRALAPSAPLHFILRPIDPHASVEGVTMRLASEDSTLVIPVSAEGIFDLPDDSVLGHTDAELIRNLKKNTLRWRPFIRSPGLAPNQRRLGDLRLECTIIWAVDYEDVPFLIRNAFRLVGGPCKSSKISVFFDADRRLASAKILYGSREAPLVLGKDENTFLPPLADASWSDDAIIEMTPVVAPVGG